MVDGISTLHSVSGAPPSAIRAEVVATFVLAARLFGRQISPV
jgi:hypothetical protein